MMIDKKSKYKFTLNPSLLIEVRKLSKSDFGVFAKRDIKKNMTIEVFPIILFEDPPLDDDGNRHTLGLFVFAYNSPPINRATAFCLGYGSLYNHKDRANACVGLLHEDDGLQQSTHRLLQIWATKKIKAGDEITINYGKSWWKRAGKNKWKDK